MHTLVGGVFHQVVEVPGLGLAHDIMRSLLAHPFHQTFLALCPGAAGTLSLSEARLVAPH